MFLEHMLNNSLPYHRLTGSNSTHSRPQAHTPLKRDREVLNQGKGEGTNRRMSSGRIQGYGRHEDVGKQNKVSHGGRRGGKPANHPPGGTSTKGRPYGRHAPRWDWRAEKGPGLSGRRVDPEAQLCPQIPTTSPTSAALLGGLMDLS